VGLQTPCDAGHLNLFHAATRVTIGDGNRALFWRSSWLGASPLGQQLRYLFKLSHRKNKTVATALLNNN
jgi:hypothetical protein